MNPAENITNPNGLLGPSTPDLPSFSEPEPNGTCHITITASTLAGSESAVIVDRADFPVWPDAPEDAPSASDVDASEALAPDLGEAEPPEAKGAQKGSVALQACVMCGAKLRALRSTKRHCSARCRVACHRDPRRGDVVAKAERRERQATPCVYPTEPGRR